MPIPQAEFTPTWIEKSGSFTALLDGQYIATASLTVTDPSPIQAKGFTVLVRNGTATVGAVAYAAGFLLYRFYHSGAWSTIVVPSLATANTWTAAQTINTGSTNTPSALAANLILSNASGTAAGVSGDAVGATGLSLYGRASDGTWATPTATVNGRILINLLGYGHNGTAWTTSPSARVQLIANSLWSGTNQETAITFWTTPSGSTTAAEVARITSTGFVVGTTGFVGTERIRTNGGVDATTLTPGATDALIGGGAINTGGKIKVSDTTEATTTAAAALVCSGGIGVAKRAFLGVIATTFSGHVLAGVQDGTADVAGAVGETLSSTVTGVAAAATGTVGNATSISVTRGKWMPRASVVISAGATGLTVNSTIKVSIVTTSATNGTSGSTMVQQSVPALIANGLWTLSINLPDINISAAATYYLTVEITYAAGSPTIAGSLIFTRSR